MRYALLIFALLCLGAGYNRNDYGGWIDADNDGLDTRQEVLIEESLYPALIEGNRVIAGVWVCPYTLQIFTDPKDLDIDHFVPLREVHESGGDKWPPDKKREYANCLDDPDHLVAVHKSANRSKGAKDPAHWLPEVNQDEYNRRWVGIKQRRNLCADEEEIKALTPYGDALEVCP